MVGETNQLFENKRRVFMKKNFISIGIMVMVFALVSMIFCPEAPAGKSG